MGNVLSKDAEYSDFHLDLSLNEKRLVRAAVKTYHTTGTYLSLKLFKRDSEQVDGDFNQKITLSAREFRLICQNIGKTRTNAWSTSWLDRLTSTTRFNWWLETSSKTGRQNTDSAPKEDTKNICNSQWGIGIISIIHFASCHCLCFHS